MPRRQIVSTSPMPELSQALSDASADQRVEVLRRVARGGSISQAARETGVSYKAAWQAIDTLSNLSGHTLVERTVGGAGGGGARITRHGEQLLALADALTRARAQVIGRLSGPAQLMHALGLRTSMRNQLPCVVEGLEVAEPDDPSVLVHLRIGGDGDGDGDGVLAASITRESADLLGLVPGLAALVMCKATVVEVRPASATTGRNTASHRPSKLCVLSGTVDRVSPGAEHAEVVLTLPGGGQWVGFAERLCVLVPGDAAQAFMPPEALVIGLAG